MSGTREAENGLEILPNAVYTLEEACKLLKTTDATARRWIKLGILPPRKLGRAYRFLGSDLLAALDNPRSYETGWDRWIASLAGKHAL